MEIKIKFPPMSRIAVNVEGCWTPGQVREARGEERLVQLDCGRWRWVALGELREAVKG